MLDYDGISSQKKSKENRRIRKKKIKMCIIFMSRLIISVCSNVEWSTVSPWNLLTCSNCFFTNIISLAHYSWMKHVFFLRWRKQQRSSSNSLPVLNPFNVIVVLWDEKWAFNSISAAIWRGIYNRRQWNVKVIGSRALTLDNMLFVLQKTFKTEKRAEKKLSLLLLVIVDSSLVRSEAS